MSAAKMGAKVMYCGHAGWFVADIFKVGNVNVVKANGKVTSGNLVRKNLEEATHQLVDMPVGGCWCPERGFFVVPEGQVTEIKKGD